MQTVCESRGPRLPTLPRFTNPSYTSTSARVVFSSFRNAYMLFWFI